VQTKPGKSYGAKKKRLGEWKTAAKMGQNVKINFLFYLLSCRALFNSKPNFFLLLLLLLLIEVPFTLCNTHLERRRKKEWKKLDISTQWRGRRHFLVLFFFFCVCFFPRKIQYTYGEALSEFILFLFKCIPSILQNNSLQIEFYGLFKPTFSMLLSSLRTSMCSSLTVKR
jgi:hypothetical protein